MKLTSFLFARAAVLFALTTLPAAVIAQDVDRVDYEEEFARYDITEGGWLSGTELDACACREYDADGDGEVTKAEFIAGRSTSFVDADPERTARTPGAWRVGDRVEAFITVDWLPATIVQIGEGPFPDDPYLVRYGQPIGGIYPTRWLGPDGIRPVSDETEAATVAAGPRLGRYTILSYGNPAQPPIRLGVIELLPGGTYRYHDGGGRLLGEGRYAFEAAANAVQWRTGTLRDQGWGGVFTVERDGKTHKIRLVRSTIAVNSLD